jgi:hypothetical protein
MSRKNVTRWAGPRCLDEICYDKSPGPLPKANKKIVTETLKKKEQRSKIIRSSIVFQRYVIVDNVDIKKEEIS